MEKDKQQNQRSTQRRDGKSIRWNWLLPRLLLLPFFLAFFLMTLAEFFPLPLIPSWSYLMEIVSDQRPADVSDVPVSVHFIDAGQSDCILIMAYGKTLLIDSGDPSVRNQVMFYLKNTKLEQIDYLLLTHPHDDHMGNMAEILQTYPVGTVIMSRLPDKLLPAGENYQEFLTALRDSDAVVKAAVPGDVYELGPVKLKLLGPVAVYDDLNNASIVCKLICSPDISFLFTGDAEKQSEKDLLERKVDLRATVLKAGHHGSSTSSTAEFLDAVSPKYTAISCGENNVYDFPHSSVLTRLKEREVQVYRTDENGTVVFKVDYDNQVQVVTQR